MSVATPAPLLTVVQQHAEEAAILRQIRAVLLRAPHVQLHRLARLDERILAHLDGLAESGEAGTVALQAMLEAPTPGAVFALAVVALQGRQAPLLTQLVSLAGALPEAEQGLVSALGWVSSEDLQGTVRALLGSTVAAHRAWALSACAMHRVDPGVVLSQAVSDQDAQVRARAWRVAGQLGRRDLADAARQLLVPGPAAPHDEHATVVIAPMRQAPSEAPAWDDKRAAAWALTLWGLGHNDLVRSVLVQAPAGQLFPPQAAHRLALMAAPLDWGRDQVRAMAQPAETDPVIKRRMMRMVAWVGDVQVLPWLIHHMADDKWARLAGECFSLITGVNLVTEGLERAASEEGAATGPSDDPEEADVAMDEDDSLPWPDPLRVQAWWQAQGGRFAQGQRYFMGAAPSPAHVLDVLQQGAQRQRIMAAEYLCLLQPGRVLFPVAAPAWRQRRWLNEEQVGSA
ncbi:MAG TPA: hypothetical protein VFW93_13495 [Aquabacterium sp.]|uniref:hypothetical protein n=1 Tax=Aquabacterium sp. TaxID=1872578 RepID=UPI002E3585C3|nr:hypothetical protein [Aquabacterium sp.]HEX5357227.1 hypothetical protein [Aquabacterium sp.]